MVKKRLVYKWSGFPMGSAIRKQICKPKVAAILYLPFEIPTSLDFKWSVLQMVGTKAIAIATKA